MSTEVNAAEVTPSKSEVPDGYALVTEGSASILQKANDVFYNPAQVINRDTSIAVLRHFVNVLQQERHERGNRGKRGVRKAGTGGITVLEAMAASGLRAIRYAKEIPGVTQVVANDLDPNVVKAMQRNIDFNDVGGRVTTSTGDCRMVMLANESTYDIVDLDPYGSPCQMLDSAVQAVADGGLLAVTATDMAVLCGNNGEACWAKYGSYPIHRSFCHEQALRILLASIEAHANRSKRCIEPLLSLSIDFYVRVFVRVYHNPTDVKASATKQMYVYQSQGCDSYFSQRVGRKVTKNNAQRYVPGQGPVVPERCPETGSGFLVGGPLWAEPIHNMDWARAVLDDVTQHKSAFPAHAKVSSIMTAVLEELPDVPLYFSLHDMCKTVKATAPKADVFKSAIFNAGFRASPTHCNPLGVKTDAPWDVLWDIMRCWIREHPVRKPEEGSYAAKLLEKPPKHCADFSRAGAALSNAKRNKQARFLPNPAPNWGPKTKHRRLAEDADDAPKAVNAAHNGAANATDNSGGQPREAAAADATAADAAQQAACAAADMVDAQETQALGDTAESQRPQQNGVQQEAAEGEAQPQNREGETGGDAIGSAAAVGATEMAGRD